MPDFYTSAQRRLQDEFETRRLADLLIQAIYDARVERGELGEGAPQTHATGRWPSTSSDHRQCTA